MAQLQEAMIITDPSEAVSKTAKLDAVVTEFAQEVRDFVNNAKDLENLGKSIGGVRAVMDDVMKILDNAEETAHGCSATMRQFVDDTESVSSFNIQL